VSLVSDLLPYIKDDIKESGTSRDDELIRYMNRCIRSAILPTLIRSRATIGLTEWNTEEVTENVRSVSLPSSFAAMHSLYCIDTYHSGTAQAGASTTITLASTASSSDDTYNAMNIRITGGTGDGQQKVITDYDGTTKVATVASSWSTNPDSTSTYVIFEEPDKGDLLVQRDVDYVRTHYNTVSSIEVYAIDGTNLLLGGIPDSTSRVLQGWYWARPTALSATSDTVPYNEYFDEVIKEYVTGRALNRDEYTVQFEAGLLNAAVSGVTSILHLNRSMTDRQPEIAGSKDV